MLSARLRSIPGIPFRHPIHGKTGLPVAWTAHAMTASRVHAGILSSLPTQGMEMGEHHCRAGQGRAGRGVARQARAKMRTIGGGAGGLKRGAATKSER